MALATLSIDAGNCCSIEGDMNFSSVEQLLKGSITYFVAGSELLFDLGKVQHADSAGVALLVEWLRLAKEKQIRVQFRNIPPQMLAIIEVSDLQRRLPITNSGQ